MVWDMGKSSLGLKFFNDLNHAARMVSPLIAKSMLGLARSISLSARHRSAPAHVELRGSRGAAPALGSVSTPALG
jgi:hypothetical protein